MPSFHQSGTGGTFTGRGYREAYIGGDSAIVVSAQLKGPSVFIPKSWKVPFVEGPLRDSLEWLVFADYGFSKLNDRTLGIDPTEHIVSVGVGGRLRLGKYLNARLDVGFPLTRYIPFSLNPRIHFGIIGALF